jgi:hypothetical protein
MSMKMLSNNPIAALALWVVLLVITVCLLVWLG